MPDDYQALFEELSGLDDVQTPEDVTPPADSTEVTPPADETDLTKPTVTPEVAPVVMPDPTQEDIKARAFAEQRAKISNYEKVFKRMQETMGVTSEEAVIEKLLGASYNVEGKARNTDPAILREIDALKEREQQKDQMLRTNFVKEEFGKVQTRFGLTDSELTDFARTLTEQNVDIFSSNLSLETLYRGFNHETITQKMLDEKKQEWIKEQAEADKAPGVNSSTGKRDTGTKTEVNSIAELDELLKNFK